MRLLRVLLFLFALPVTLMSNAEEYIVVDGISYKVYTDGSAVVYSGDPEWDIREYDVVHSTPYTPNQNYVGDIVIPEQIEYNGKIYTVSGIEGHYASPGGIRYGAFEGCSQLTSIAIPKSVKKIGFSAFEGCSSLNAVFISDLTAWCDISFSVYDERNGTLFSTSTNPISYAHNLYLNNEKVTELVIPNDVVKIKSGTFIGANINSAIFHKEVTDGGQFTFYGCNNLSDIYSYSPNMYLAEMFGDKNIENTTLHIRERYKDFYCELVEHMNYGFKDICFISGVDFHLCYSIDGEVYKDILYEYGESIISESEPQKEGYTFSGWSEIPETMPDHDVTVTGSFAPNTYKLTYNVDGEKYKVVEVKYDEAITAEPEPTKKGMTFSGWSNIPEKMPKM